MKLRDKNKFRYYRQMERKDCGPTCLQMLASYYGKYYPVHYIGSLCYGSRLGVSMAGMQKGGETLGFDTFVTQLTETEIFTEAPLPAVIYWKKNHYVVLVGAGKGSRKDTHAIIADPERGKLTITREELRKNWLNSDTGLGFTLLAEPTEVFHAADVSAFKKNKVKGLPILQQIRSFKNYFIQIALGMLVAAAINLFFPILTRQLIDKGVMEKNLSLITLLLLAQLALFTGNILVETVRSWSVLYINARINIQIISAFLIKLIRLPIGFFDTRMMTDIMLRIDDHERIEEFLSSSSLNVLFSFITIITLSAVFCFYSPFLFLIFLLGSILSVLWVVHFLKKRKAIDYSRFELMSENRNQLYEVIDGMCEIKLNNAEKIKRFEWERQRVNMYGVNKKALSLDQFQHIGFGALTQLKSFAITYLAAYFVVQGQISLGTMLSITLLTGQLNQPLESFVQFFQSLQNARISLNRLNDIYSKQDEEELYNSNMEKQEDRNLAFLPNHISLHNISFSYNGALGPDVFSGLSFTIPQHKVTAIVGSSGSGKTTLFKLLLKFYEPATGSIHIDDLQLTRLHPDDWRARCGVVMQDGYIFSDSILRNVAVADEKPDMEKVKRACRMANIHGFIDELPLGYQTQIGGSGIGLSAGQRQRILIARAVYKNPDYLFFDEATSALDAHNEKIIMENLEQFYKGKTVVIIAHRLSTVKNADKIIVLNKGHITEQGNHEELTGLRGYYYTLIKNQLELGN
jgi:ATP-binding cassette, subfamily B, bacterial